MTSSPLKEPGVSFRLSSLLCLLSFLFVFLVMHHDYLRASGRTLQWLGFYPYPKFAGKNYVFFLSIAGVVAAYCLLIRSILREKIENLRLSSLFKITAAAAIPLLLLPHLFSSDIYDYIMHGRMVTVYRTNPFLTSMAEHQEDPLFGISPWSRTPSVYGPAWLHVCVLLLKFSELIGDSMEKTVLLFKFSTFIFHAANGYLIFFLTKTLSRRGRFLVTAFYLLNPLVLIEFAGNGHNDALMIFFLLLGFLSAQKNNHSLAAVFFTLASISKIYSLPVLCLYIAQRFWTSSSLLEFVKKTGFSLLCATIAILLVYAPFGLNASSFLAPFAGPATAYVTKSWAYFSLYQAPFDTGFISWVSRLLRVDQTAAVHKLALTFVALFCFVSAFIVRNPQRFRQTAAWYAFAWCISAVWFHPWYVTFFVALAAIADSMELLVTSGLYSFFALLPYVSESNSFPLPAGPMLEALKRYYLVFVFGVPLITSLIFVFKRPRRIA